MISRRLALTGLPALVCSCTSSGGIDPVAVADALKKACGILVPAATIAAIISASVGATVASIVDLLCSGYTQAVAAQAAQGKRALAAGETVEYDVVVGGKTIHVVATKS